MNINKVVVVGGGTMGAGIAQLFAQHGFYTTICEINQELADAARQRVEKSLRKRVEKGKMSAGEMEQIMAHLSAAAGLEPVREADFVVESVIEVLDAKKQVFTEADKLARPGVILVTNTTSLSISAMAEVTSRPELVCQMHFFNPPVVMKLVEIMPGKKTAPETIEKVRELAVFLGKDPVVCKDEAPAGIVSRCLGQLLNEATWLVESGVAEPADIDKAMKLGANHPMGPLELIDMIGLDVHRAKMQTLQRVLDDPRYRHPPVVDRLIEQGKLGRKTGEGFYKYEKK
ncbi:MAG: 3-hydroxyacyl-CoA dehydrogenase family protein [Deltaproteobacteria bacterium]|nr:MAG: 3-hydroxyacyl-CoA dehydrogenase family protein [Deltaproteobacteria bacterium]